TITTNVAAGVTNAVVNYTVTVSDNCGVASTNIVPASGTTFPLGTTPVVAIATDLSGNTSTCSFNVVVSDLPPVPHDLAITKLKVSKSISLKGGTPVTKSASVSIVNLSEHSETITTYSNLVSLVGASLSNICPNATVVLHVGKPNKDLPLTLAPKKKLTVRFDVTYDCANDAEKGTSHQDFRFTATVNHAAIDGNADTAPANDVCPRPANSLTGDKGCNKGLEAFTDVSIKSSNNQ
ncbi:MAG: HYR domain-containing protein, partial [Verrucomicrobiota bacterium]